MSQLCRVAACHVAPIWLAARETTDLAISLINKAASNKADLVVFSETFIAAFPVWSAVRPPTDNHDFFKRMVNSSISAEGEEMNAIRAAARKANIHVSLGFSERPKDSIATLFNSNIIIGQRGEVLNHHRKLMPTFFEKLTWAPGDGYGLKVVDTPFGKVGNLICGENTNPLARYSLMAQGEQLHISTWPAIWPTRSSISTSRQNDLQGSKDATYDNVAANRTRAAAHCFEAKCYGVLCSGFVDARAVESISNDYTSTNNDQKTGHDAVRTTIEGAQRGATMFLDPTGALLPGYIIDESTGQKQPKDFLQKEQGILYADMDMENCIEGKQYHDVVGGYQRLDVFQLQVNRVRRKPAQFHNLSNTDEAGKADSRNNSHYVDVDSALFRD